MRLSLTFIIYLLTFSLCCPFFLLSEENFLLLEASINKLVLQTGNGLDVRRSPCSTFKIPLSLMGYDSRILLNKTQPEWNYRENYIQDIPSMYNSYIEAWKKAYRPDSWIRYSCIWYSQQLAKQIGKNKIQKYLQSFKYGNCDLVGNSQKNDSIKKAWLMSSLLISPREQAYFLQKLVLGLLPISKTSLMMTRELLYMEDLEPNCKLYGKVGSGRDEKEGKYLSWFVGWVEKEEKIYVFVYNCLKLQFNPAERLERVKTFLYQNQIISDLEVEVS
ncbi:MAG: bla [Chlamydiales bacterium]|jgi:beta-lactamase class D|nr:bla [Chlamydiales bacterium]